MQGRYADSRVSVAAAARIFENLGEVRMQALYGAYLAAAHAALGDGPAAESAFEHAKSIFSELDDKLHLAFVDVLRGLLDVSAGAREKAVERIERAKHAPEGASATARSEDLRFAIRMVRAALERTS